MEEGATGPSPGVADDVDNGAAAAAAEALGAGAGPPRPRVVATPPALVCPGGDRVSFFREVEPPAGAIFVGAASSAVVGPRPLPAAAAGSCSSWTPYDLYGKDRNARRRSFSAFPAGKPMPALAVLAGSKVT